MKIREFEHLLYIVVMVLGGLVFFTIFQSWFGQIFTPYIQTLTEALNTLTIVLKG